MSKRYLLAKALGRLLPPIISQTVRNKIITIEEGELLNKDFTIKSLTGSVFHGNTSDFHAFKFSVHGYFDWRNIVIANEVMKQNQGDIAEIGANIGTETISYCDIAKKYNNDVFAFEPLPSNVDFLKKNKSENDLKNLHISECLVSNFDGISNFSVPQGNNSGSGHIVESHDFKNSKEFKVVSLDNYLRGKKLSLITIDVEGHEYQVMKGAEDLIKKNRPILILEVVLKYLKSRGHVSLDEFCNYLTSLNYEFFSIERLGITKVGASNLKNRNNKNWVCIPKENVHLKKVLNNSIFNHAIKPMIRIN